MLMLVLGALGSGKTLISTVECLNSSKNTIVSNIGLNIPNKEIIDFNMKKFLKAEYSNCIILLDEIYNYLESRISMAELNRQMSYIVFQSRKKYADIIGTAQIMKTVDLRFRELIDIMAIGYGRTPDSKEDFNYLITDGSKTRGFTFDYNKMIPYFNMYDTREIVFHRDERTEYKLSTKTNKIDKINEYANSIEDYYENKGIDRITQNMISTYFDINELPKCYIKNVFTEITIRYKNKKKEKHTKNEPN